MKASCVRILGILGRMIVNWGTKIRDFLAWKSIYSLITQKPLDVQSWNFCAMWVLINALCKPSLGVPGQLTKILLAENGQKVNEFEPIHLRNYRYWKKWFVIFEHTINHLSFDYARLPQLEYYFSCFVSFFLFHLMLSIFKSLYAHCIKI